MNQPWSFGRIEVERAQTRRFTPPAQHEELLLAVVRDAKEATLVARVEEHRALLRNRADAFHAPESLTRGAHRQEKRQV